MAEVLFFKSDFVKRNTTMNSSLLDDYFKSSLKVTQDTRLHPLLGTDLYENLKTEVAAGTLAGDYLTLMNTYVVWCLLWYFMYDFSEDLFTKVDNGGLGIRTSDQVNGATREDLNARKSQYKTRANHYENRLKDYLCENSSLFPEYSTNSGADIKPIESGDSSGIEISFGNSRRSAL